MTKKICTRFCKQKIWNHPSLHTHTSTHHHTRRLPWLWSMRAGPPTVIGRVTRHRLTLIRSKARISWTIARLHTSATASCGNAAKLNLLAAFNVQVRSTSWRKIKAATETLHDKYFTTLFTFITMTVTPLEHFSEEAQRALSTDHYKLSDACRLYNPQL